MKIPVAFKIHNASNFKNYNLQIIITITSMQNFSECRDQQIGYFVDVRQINKVSAYIKGYWVEVSTD